MDVRALRQLAAAVSLCAAAAACAQGGEWRYEVTEGDTLAGIGAEHLARPGQWRELQKLNGIDDPRRLKPGTRLRIPIARLRRSTPAAEVVFVQGKASVRRGPGGEPAELTVGSSLGERDTVRTDADSSVTLRFVDGSRLLVSPGSEVSIGRLRELGKAAIVDTRVGLDKGAADARVLRERNRVTRFDVSTPVVNLGVRGTEFRARVDDAGARTRVEVLEGVVSTVAGRREVRVPAGFGSVVEAGQRGDVPQPLAAAPDLGGVPAIVDRMPVRMTWQPAPRASGYRAQVVSADAADRLLLESVSREPVARWADLADGRYVLRVRVVDAQGLEGVAASAAFTVKARPQPPFTQLPRADGRYHGPVATFAWAKPANAQRYRLQVAATPDFAAPLLDESDIEQPGYEWRLRPGAYHWRVATIAAGNDQGPFSDAQAFTQAEIPASPQLQPPQRDEAGLVFQWPAPAPGQTVQFQVASDPRFENIVLDTRTQAARAVLPDPRAGVYFLRARTIDDADGYEGDYGDTQRVEVPPSRWWLLVPLGVFLLVL
jgi:hypothetical protein